MVKKAQIEKAIDDALKGMLTNETAQLLGLELFLLAIDEADIFKEAEAPIVFGGGHIPLIGGMTVPLPTLTFGSKLSLVETALGAAIILSAFKPLEGFKGG